MLIYKISTRKRNPLDLFDLSPLMVELGDRIAYVVLPDEEETSENTLSLILSGRCIRSFTIDEYRKFLNEKFNSGNHRQYNNQDYERFNGYLDKAIKTFDV